MCALNKVKGMDVIMEYLELGGFAENPEEIDGDFDSFNYCLAEEYAIAMSNEDFGAIGNIDIYMLDSICYWLNYDGRHDNERLVSDIKSGKLITNNKQSIIDAIYAKKNSSLAETYLNYGVYSPKLVLAIILSNENDVVANIDVGVASQEEFTERVDQLYSFIEEEFKNQKDKEEFILKIWEGFSNITYESQLKLHCISDCEYKWVKCLKKQTNKKKD